MNRIRRPLRHALTVALLAGGIGFSANLASAQQSLDDTSVRLAPKNADFYIGMFDGEKQFSALRNGPVIQSLLALPVVTDNWNVFMELWDEPESKLAPLRFAWDSPVLQDILKFTGDVMSTDLFLFGDGNGSRWSVSANHLIHQLATSSPDGVPPESSMLEMLDSLNKSLDEIPLPQIVMGGKFSNEYEAVSRVDQVELLLGVAQQADPQVARMIRQIKRIDDDRGSRLSLDLTGKMIPWDLIQTNEQFTPVIKSRMREVLQDRKLNLTLGMLDGYFIAAIGPSSDSLLNWKNRDGLNTNELLKPAKDNQSKNLTHLAYTSDAMAEAQFETNFKDVLIKNFEILVKELEKLGSTDEEAKTFLNEAKVDVERLNDTLMTLLPKFRGGLQYSWLRENGSEQLSHSFTDNPLLDGSKTLALADRAGLDPSLSVVTRFQKHPEYFSFVADVVSTAKRLLARMVELDLVKDEEDLESLKKFNRDLETLWPTIERTATIFETKIYPAIGVESSFSVSSREIRSAQSVEGIAALANTNLPESMPIYEFGWVQQMDEPKLFIEGIRDLRIELNSLIRQIAELADQEVPDWVNIPEPEVIDNGDKVKHVYPLPESSGISELVLPQATYSGNTLVLTLTDEYSEELIKSGKANRNNSLLDPAKNYANASSADVSRLLEVVTTWIKTTVSLNVDDLDANLIDTRTSLDADFSLTANDLLAIWDVLTKVGRFESVTTVPPEGGTVTRTVYTQSLP